MHGVPFVAFVCDFVYFFLKNTRSTITSTGRKRVFVSLRHVLAHLIYALMHPSCVTFVIL